MHKKRAYITNIEDSQESVIGIDPDDIVTSTDIPSKVLATNAWHDYANSEYYTTNFNFQIIDDYIIGDAVYNSWYIRIESNELVNIITVLDNDTRSNVIASFE